MQRSLTAPERETVVLMDDETDTALITTWQRKTITKLKRNPVAELVWEQSLGSSVGAQFTMPAALISFRSKQRKGRPGNPEAFRNTQSPVK